MSHNTKSTRKLQRNSGPQRPLAGGARAPWCQDDSRWFKSHPLRSHRVRAAFPGELNGNPHDPTTDRIAVRQVHPGARARLQFRVRECSFDMFETLHELLARAAHSEGVARLLYDLATAQSDRLIPPAELRRMIADYETTPSFTLN